MRNDPEIVKEKIDAILTDMANHHWLFTENPGHSFMRQHLGKLDFRETIRFILSMGKGTVSDEILDYFKLDENIMPTQSAFNQRRKQISLSAFKYLFDEFSSSFPQITHQFKNHCILACDGTHVVYTTNSDIIEDYNKPRLIDYKGYNHMHLNGLVDVVSKSILDVVIQPGQHPDEREALHIMLDHFQPDHPENFIVTADRGYESYDLLFHCILKQIYYVFRVKAPSSPKSMLSSYKNDLPDHLDEFDVTVKRYFTDSWNKTMKSQTHVYHYMNPTKEILHFVPLLDGNHLVFLSFRVIKLKAPDGSYEYLITNLPRDFDIDDIRAVYHWRWGCEISFRYLKHAAGLLHFHARKPEYILQEVYARLVMYNFGTFLANEAAKENQKKPRDPNNKYQYSIDFSTALRTSRKYFLRDTDEKPINIVKLLSRFVHAVKEEFRQFKRPLRGIGAIHFHYR